MENIYLVIVIGIIVIIGFYFRFIKSSSDFDNTKRSDFDKPSKFIKNDKIIVIKNIKEDLLKKIITQFCNGYNQNDWKVLPKLTIDKFEYQIVFPYDIDFEIFCYFINYLKYPENLSNQDYHRPEITGWCTTKSTDKWMKSDIENKEVMIYIPDWDDEYDNVYLTTQDNLSFLMGFALGESSKKLEKNMIDFKKRPNNMKITKFIETIDFE